MMQTHGAVGMPHIYNDQARENAAALISVKEKR
jgi:hypothetical protein